MNEKLTINYEEFPEEGIKVLTVSKGDEALHMIYDDEAEKVYHMLLGKLTTK